MKNLFVLIGIMLFLSSCDNPVYYNIPENEKPILKDKDTVVFIDRKNNNKDSFLIKRTDDYRVSDKRYYYETIDLRYQRIGINFAFEEFSIQKSVSTSISCIGGNYYTAYRNVDTISLIINNIEYESVFVERAFNFPDSIPNKVYYSHQYGIIKYSFSDGRYFELNSKIH